MERWRGKVAVVTGASSGIGAATALELARQGMQVVGLARRQERVDSLAPQLPPRCAGVLRSYKADVRSEDEVVAAFRWVEEQFGGADVLVNNAGIMDEANIQDGTVDRWKAVLETNVIGTMTCTREFLKSLDKRGLNEGHIININSVLGHVTECRLPMYVASKHALRALSGCLRRNLADKDSRIKVTDICPGITKTEILHGTSAEALLDHLPFMEAEDIAAAVVAALGTSSVTQICEMVLNPTPTKMFIY